MTGRFEAAGNGGSGRGMVDVSEICPGFAMFKANSQKPPPDEEMPVAIAEVLQKWILANPIRVRETLPIVQRGNTETQTPAQRLGGAAQAVVGRVSLRVE